MVRVSSRWKKVVVKIGDGEDFPDSLVRICEGMGVKTAEFRGIGALREAVITEFPHGQCLFEGRKALCPRSCTTFLEREGRRIEERGRPSRLGQGVFSRDLHGCVG